MRLKIKKEVQTLLHTLKKANSKIAMLVQSDCPEMLGRLLETCQNAAISIGTAIENEAGQNTRAVNLLEEYCEELFLILQSGNLDISRLESLLWEAEEAFNSLPVTYEIVFLPYKASMWDSMESVWQAAETMENCKCHVVPLPYYDRNTEGELGAFHYEGEEFPTDVPIQDWKTFPIQQLRPDIIFIHNPYDQMNYATSVHPAFYSESLKKMTERLVLLPYAVSSKEHVAEAFAVLPGILYADNVFVQSGTLCKEHIEWFHKWEKEYQCEGIFGNPEEKFRVFGSPKFDKAWSAKREEYLYPMEWLQKVQRPDGSRKTAFLLNTSMNQLLHCEEMYLKKLRHVLEMFRENKEVLLVWRPHPLMEQTMRAMRPELLKEYREIIQQFREEDWGIYDETADMYMAITFTDVYYGDWSSVATLYQCTGKPVILENYKAFQLDKLAYQTPLNMQQITISSFCLCGSDMYLYDSLGDVIYCADIVSGKATAIAMLPHGKPGFPGYIHIERVGDYLIIVPLQDTEILFYHLKTQQITKFERNKAASLRFCYAYNQQVYFPPLWGQDMVRIDFAQQNPVQVKELKDWYTERKPEAELPFKSNGLPLAQGSRIFIPYQSPYGVAEFDCDVQRVVKCHNLPDCATMAFDGDKYWWCDTHGQLYCWEYERDSSTLVHDFKTDLEREPEGVLVYFLAYVKGFLFLLPHQYYPYMENKVFRVNVNTFEIEEIPELKVHAEKLLQPNKNLRCYCGTRVNEQAQICTYCNARNTIIRIEPATCEVQEVPMQLDAGCFMNNKTAGYIQEAPVLLLEYFLEYWGSASGQDTEREKMKSILESRAWKQIMLRIAKDGDQDIGLEYLDGKCGERIMHYLLRQFEEADE